MNKSGARTDQSGDDSGMAPKKGGRPTNEVADIQGTSSKPMKQFQPQKQNLCMDITDIDGTHRTWLNATK